MLSRTGKAELVHARIILDIITSLELEKPRPTPVLPQWDLGIVLEALGKPSNEPLWQFVPFELACSGQGFAGSQLPETYHPHLAIFLEKQKPEILFLDNFEAKH